MMYKLPQVLKNLTSFHPALRRKITYKELGEAIGVRQQTVSGYIHGICSPTAEHLLKMAEYLQVSVDYLLTGRESDRKIDDKFLINELLSVQDQASEILDITEKIINKLEESE